MDRKPFEKRFAALKQEYEAWMPHHKELSKYILPGRGFFSDEPNRPKAPDYKVLIDGTSMRAAEVLASGMTSGLTSPSRPWFKLGVPNPKLMELEDVRVWTSEVESRMMAVFSKSNIYGVLYSIYEELGGFATGGALLLEDFQDVIRGYNLTIGEYYLGSGPDGRVNSLAREFWLTVGQLVEQFGIDNVSEDARSSYKNGDIDRWVKVCQLIEPNDQRVEGFMDFKNMTFRSVYWEEGSPQDTFLKIHGFAGFPGLTPRWGINRTSDSYGGTSPGWKTLGDIRMLQKMQKDKLLALDKVVNPPVQVDASVQGDPNMLPGGVTRFSGSTPNAGAKTAYQISPDLNAIEASIYKVQQSIEKGFFNDLFLMLAMSDSRQMTAREVVERHEEKLLMLGPVLERLESELLDPLINRTFEIMLRVGLIPEAPKPLHGVDLDVEYVSVLAQAQKMVGTANMEQFNAFLGNIAAVKPDVVDMIDFDEEITEYGERLGIAPKIIRSKDKVIQIRAERQQAAQAQQMMQNAGSAVQGAKVLSDTQVGESSALDMLLGMSGGRQ